MNKKITDKEMNFSHHIQINTNTTLITRSQNIHGVITEQGLPYLVEGFHNNTMILP